MRKALIVFLVIVGLVCAFYLKDVISGEEKQPFSLGPFKFGAKQPEIQEPDDFYKEIELFTDALTFIRSEYVEDAKYKDLIYGSLRGMLKSLDPYSQFLDPDEYKEVKVETEGEFGGLGIQIGIKDGLLTVIAPIDDTPAFHAGLKAGDKIVKIDGEITRDIVLTEAVKKLRGKPGTQVDITIMREGEEKLLDFTITRDIVKVASIRKVKLFEDNIGYIRLSEFQEKSADDLEEALKKLEGLGMEALILDLRNNPGGLLDSAVKVTEKFIPAGKVIVSTRSRDGAQDMVFKSSLIGRHRSSYPLIVLVSKGSASGSEIVAGAIQDYKRGILLGTTTFGKGSVQTVIPLADGSALRLTTSRYFTPNGRLIHEKGIEPDVEVEFEGKEYTEEEAKPKPSEAVFEQIEQQPITAEPKPEEKDGTKIKLQDYMRAEGFDDNQLVRAVDLLKGIKFYKKHEEQLE